MRLAQASERVIAHCSKRSATDFSADEVTIRLERGALRMTVTEFEAPMELRSLSVGQLGEVQVAAEDIHWGGYILQRAHAVLHNVHLRPTAPPLMVAAPVEVSVELTPGVVDELLTRFVPRVTGQLSPRRIGNAALGRPSGRRQGRGRTAH